MESVLDLRRSHVEAADKYIHMRKRSICFGKQFKETGESQLGSRKDTNEVCHQLNPPVQYLDPSYHWRCGC